MCSLYWSRSMPRPASAMAAPGPWYVAGGAAVRAARGEPLRARIARSMVQQATLLIPRDLRRLKHAVRRSDWGTWLRNGRSGRSRPEAPTGPPGPGRPSDLSKSAQSFSQSRRPEYGCSLFVWHSARPPLTSPLLPRRPQSPHCPHFLSGHQTNRVLFTDTPHRHARHTT